MPVKKLFLSVGAMKAGTTFLFNALGRHPDIYFTPEKELHFFAQTDGLSAQLRKPLVTNAIGDMKATIFGPGDILSDDFRRHRLAMVMRNRFAKLKDADRLREIVSWYAERYLCNPIDDHWFDQIFDEAGDRYAADFSNYNALLDSAGWRHAKSLAEQLRVVYVLRHPVARLWSHIKFHYIQSGRRDQLEKFDIDDLQHVLREGSISAHARYGDIVENLQRHLSREELKVVVFEDFTSDFLSAARGLEHFLGISENNYPHVDPARRANATENIAIPDNMRSAISSAVAPQLEKLSGLGIEVPENYWA